MYIVLEEIERDGWRENESGVDGRNRNQRRNEIDSNDNYHKTVMKFASGQVIKIMMGTE